MKSLRDYFETEEEKKQYDELYERAKKYREEHPELLEDDDRQMSKQEMIDAIERFIYTYGRMGLYDFLKEQAKSGVLKGIAIII